MRITLAVTLAAAAVPAQAVPVHKYDALVMSPAGDVVAAIESIDEPLAHGRIVVRSVAGGRVLRTIDPCAKCAYSDLMFGSTGDLAFLSRDRTAGTVALNVTDATVRVRTIATVRGIAQKPRFAPDGKRIAVLVTLDAAKEAGATEAGARQVGEIGEAPDQRRIAIFSIAGKVAPDAVRPISPAGRYVYEYDWTPDGRGFVATTALGNGDNNWWVATIDAIDAASGAVRQIARPATQANFPRVSPDGKTVAYIGGLMSDFGSVGGDLWTVPFAGGKPVNMTPGYKASVTSLVWLASGLRATTLAGADQAIVRFDPRKSGVVLWSGPASFAAGDARVAFSADGRTAATVVQDFEHAPAIYAGPLQAPRKLTNDNDALPAAVTARSVTWTNGGFSVQGWLLAPRGVDAAARAPMIVNVHGGPAAASTPTYIGGESVTADLARAGYYIFLPNPRGSYGQGEAFTLANRRDFGGGDLKDILAGIDAVKKVAPVDEDRLGMMGGSYGGFMSMWANTQTNRFKGIVAGAGLSNWISYYGTNGIDQWMLPFFGKSMYDDPKAYADVSAINFIKRARTPTFIYVGERDIEVPPTQSVEYWHALREMGVPTSLVIYADEGHRIRDAAHAADVRKRTVAWFDKYVKAAR
ncbi:alpha/beta hydrolase family protein [Sphingomonas crusticola]|uniref:S9 family peptidase n=1 Tax=Sphingomonas crusticola TaxID=1697973 RepID=UPI000E234122|nr:S9 family peptidase [Sphingomonas crusticola]